MSDEPNNGNENEPLGQRLIENAYGNRFYTLEALQDSVISQFFAEMADRDDLLSALDTSKKQRQAILDALEYVVATEYVVLTTNEKRWVLDNVQREVFRLGPLDEALKDESVTEISILDWRDISVRRGFGKLEPYPKSFETYDHLEHLLPYVLAPLGISVGPENPFIDVGVTVAHRQLRLSLSGPPLRRSFTGLIRVHPSTPLHLDDLAPQVPHEMQAALQKIVENCHGLLIVGEGGYGKTTLLANLLQYVPEGATLIQRAHEVHPELLPDHVQNRVVIPVQAGTTDVFEQMIEEAVNATPTPSMLLLDEVHGDERKGLWQLFSDTSIPIVMTFRGRGLAARMYSALTMALRRSNPSAEQWEIQRILLERIPFVAIFDRPQADVLPRLNVLGQWEETKGQMTIRPVLNWDEDGNVVRTGAVPRFDLWT